MPQPRGAGGATGPCRPRARCSPPSAAWRRRSRPRASALLRSSWSARWCGWLIPTPSRRSMAELVDVSDPADERLGDYRDLRDVNLRKHLEAEHGLFLAEGEKVVRRAV